MSKHRVEPALTPEEWAEEPRAVFWRGGYAREDDWSAPQGPGGKRVCPGSKWVELDGGRIGVGDDSWWVAAVPEQRHALAALCLQGQPFGFTWEDVDLLRHGPDESHEDDWLSAYADLADRIEALLPPRTEP